MTSLIGSVGRGGKNLRQDVVEVQKLINAELPVSLSPLIVDGVCGAKTIFAIGEYQRRNMQMNAADDRVDPKWGDLSSADQEETAVPSTRFERKFKRHSRTARIRLFCGPRLDGCSGRRDCCQSQSGERAFAQRCR